jgi:hypothetical protein
MHFMTPNYSSLQSVKIERITMIKRLLVIGSAFVFLTSGIGSSQTITASKPTHYFFSPTPYVNNPYDLVISLHEISFTLPAHLELQSSILDNVGRMNLGAKYGFTDRFCIGAGMAWSFVTFEKGGHGIKHEFSPRLGLLASYGFVRSQNFEANITPQMQIGDHFSLGVDFSLMGTPHPFWSIIWELGTSLDLSEKPDPAFYINTDAGVRIHPPAIPFLNFDVGIDLVEARLDSNYAPHVFPYFDVIFAMKTKK